MNSADPPPAGATDADSVPPAPYLKPVGVNSHTATVSWFSNPNDPLTATITSYVVTVLPDNADKYSEVIKKIL